MRRLPCNRSQRSTRSREPARLGVCLHGGGDLGTAGCVHDEAVASSASQPAEQQRHRPCRGGCSSSSEALAMSMAFSSETIDHPDQGPALFSTSRGVMLLDPQTTVNHHDGNARTR